MDDSYSKSFYSLFMLLLSFYKLDFIEAHLLF